MGVGDAPNWQDALAATQQLLDELGGKGVIIGGVAVGLIAEPRMTQDVDAMLLLDIDDLPTLLTTAEKCGLVPRISDVVAFARRSRVVLLSHAATGTDVDISLGMLPIEWEIVERAQRIDAGGLFVRLPTPEDLIILKAIAHRPKDLLDIQTIVETYPQLDRKRIERWMRDFADTLELPELWDDIVPLLKRAQ